MKGPFCVIFVFSTLFVSTNEQCPQPDVISTITSCEGSTKYGPNIQIDFYKINRTCTCSVSPHFAGKLLVISIGGIYHCSTKIYVTDNEKTVSFGCQKDASSITFNAQINQTVEVRAKDESSSTTGEFFYCLGFQPNGGLNGNVSVMCGSPPEAATTTVSSTTSTTTLTSTQLSHASTPIEPSIETTATPLSVVNPIENTDATLSSSTINISYDSLSMDSTSDNPEMLYIIAGSAGGGAIILGLIIFILVLINRTKGANNRKGPTEANMARTNEVFNSNPELPDNPLYLTSQPLDELGYSSDQEKQLGLPPTDSKTKKKINPDYDVPPNNKPIAYGTSSMPVYAVPKKRSQDLTPEISPGDVYAEVCKPNRSTGKDPVRKRNEDGLLYREAEQVTAATKQTNTKDKHEITEGVCYAEIKHT